MSYKHHHRQEPNEAPIRDNNDYTELNWVGEAVSFQSEIGELSFIPNCYLAAIGVEWKATDETVTLLKKYGVEFWRKSMRSGKRAYVFKASFPRHDSSVLEVQEQVEAFKAISKEKLVEFSFYGGLSIYLLPIPECPFQEWWDSIYPKLSAYIEAQKWVKDNSEELEAKGWALDEMYSGFRGIDVFSDGAKVQLRSYRCRAGAIYLRPGDLIPLAEDVSVAYLAREAQLKEKYNEESRIKNEIEDLKKKPQTMKVKDRISQLQEELKKLNKDG